MPYSHQVIPGNPSFRGMAVNSVAMVPLLSTDTAHGEQELDSYSNQSFHDLFTSLLRYSHRDDNDNNDTSTTTSTTTTNTTTNHRATPQHEGLQDISIVDSNHLDTTTALLPPNTTKKDGVLLVVPNSQLTRPGDWRYDSTPLRNFHWGHGCQRMMIFDGRRKTTTACTTTTTTTKRSREAHDWMDLIPSRQVSAVIGILSIRDVTSFQQLHHAEQEFFQMVQWYSSNSRPLSDDKERKQPIVQRLFVFDSFHPDVVSSSNNHNTTTTTTTTLEELSKMTFGTNLVAFPPSDAQHISMMDLHVSVVVNDLAVTIFQQLQHLITESDALCHYHKSSGSGGAGSGIPDSRVKTHSLLKVSSKQQHHHQQQHDDDDDDEPLGGGTNLSVANIANIVSPANQLAASSSSSSSLPSSFQSTNTTTTTTSNPTTTTARENKHKNPLKSIVESAKSAVHHTTTPTTNKRHLPTPQLLLTPLDTIWDLSELQPRDAEAMKKRDVARREKLAADLSLLAGSPMDAYERYSKAAELCKASSPDPLWYASALEGCAAAHIAMAEAGGYNVDSYLEQNFTLADEFMAYWSSSAGTESRKSSQTTKQTLPSVVFALCEEALHITNRHAKLAPLHAELLLKLAHYVAEGSDDAHLRCRWGEGEGCYSGRGDATSTDAELPPRWERTSVSKLVKSIEFKSNTNNNKDGEDVLLSCTFQRCQKWTDLLHRAASTGALPPLTRANVAATCARMCFQGMVPTQWKTRRSGSSKRRIPMLRKAAFFTTVAADAISKCRDLDYTVQASALWLAASQFYSRTSNVIDNDKDEVHDYGWATLRASTLDALSQQDDDKWVSEAAAEVLLSLLCEMSPKVVTAEKADLRASLKALDMALQIDDHPIPVSSRHSTDGGADDRSDTDTIVSSTGRHSTYSKPNRSMSFRSSFFAQQHNAAASLLAVAQAKWAEDDPIPQVDVPLSGLDQELSVVLLNCALPKIRSESCATAQKRCISHISELRRDMPAVSSSSAESTDPHYAFSLAGDSDINEAMVPPPLCIVSAMVVPSEAHLLLERCKAQVATKDGNQQQGAMATFFNPYDIKKQAEKKSQAMLVAEGEERKILFEFSNCLTVPLDIPSCQIVFDNVDTDRINTPSLSFVVPPKAKKFRVKFPFIVLKAGEGEYHMDETDEATPCSNVYEVKGLRVTYLSRSYFIPLRQLMDAADRQIPDPASVYQLRLLYDSKRKDESIKLRIEVLPAQPRLQISFDGTRTDIVDGTTIAVHLSDGEIFTMPSFHVRNDIGPTGRGTIERLQIVGMGLPGLSDEVLFDSDANDDMKSSELDSNEWASEMDKAGLPPLKIRAICTGLSLETINSNQNDGGSAKFQISAMHDMSKQVAGGGNVRLRFRYRGVSLDPATEIWRKREIKLSIVKLKAPRISSLAFRPDLSWGSAYTELCSSLAKQVADYAAIKREWKLTSESREQDLEKAQEKDVDKNSDLSTMKRVGMDAGLHVSSSEVVVIMSLANETDSSIVLSNRDGLVGGFEGCPMPTMSVASGVSVKIPVVIPRIKRTNEDGSMTDIVSEVVSRLSLQWESVGDKASRDTGRIRQGRIRIPCSCLRDIIDNHPSFVSRICEPPVAIKVSMGRNESEHDLVVSPGSPVDVFVEIETADWVPKEVVEKCRVTLEFCAARQDKKSPSPGELVWCGLIRRTMRLGEVQKRHRARIVFLQAGAFVVSACAKLVNDNGNGAEEVWWPTLAENVVVETSNVSAQ